MTLQYLAGELSLLLADLQAIAEDGQAAREFARLRREAETIPPTTLAAVATRALALADQGCMDSLTLGNAREFARRAAISAQLWEFAVCAGLVEELARTPTPRSPPRPP